MPEGPAVSYLKELSKYYSSVHRAGFSDGIYIYMPFDYRPWQLVHRAVTFDDQQEGKGFNFCTRSKVIVLNFGPSSLRTIR